MHTFVEQFTEVWSTNRKLYTQKKTASPSPSNHQVLVASQLEMGLWDIFVKFSQGFKGGLQGPSCCLWCAVSNAFPDQAPTMALMAIFPSPDKVHFRRAVICQLLSKTNPTVHFPHSFIKVWDRWANLIRDRNSEKQGQHSRLPSQLPWDLF